MVDSVSGVSLLHNYTFNLKVLHFTSHQVSVFKFTHSRTHLLVASALIIVKTSSLQPTRVFPLSRPDCRCKTKRHTQSAANRQAFSLTFNTTPASRAALLMPPAESVDPVSPLSSVSTEQLCDAVIYTQASANAHSCHLAGCKTTRWSFVPRGAFSFNQKSTEATAEAFQCVK